MVDEQRDADWRTLTEEVLSGMREWRSAHPKASFAELEVAVEERLSRLRARMLEEAALSGVDETAAGAGAGAGVTCPDCGAASGGLVARGRRARSITVAGNQPVRLERRYSVCPACGVGLFPPR